MPILAALAHLDADQHALGVDVADAQHDDFAAAQSGAVGNAEGSLVLEAWTGSRFEKAADIIGAQHTRQLLGIMRAGDLMGEVNAAAGNGEEEAQRRGLRVHLRRLGTLGNLICLKTAQIIAGNRIGRAAKELRQRLDMLDIVVLGLVTEVAVRHVLQHAAAKVADGLLETRVGHRGLLS